MNKFVASLGFVALGTSALHAVEASALNDKQSTKPLSVAVSLRGFYDSNIDSLPNGQSSYGYEVAPSVDFGLAGEQTSFNLGYAFSAKYYEKRRANSSDKWSFTHTFDVGLAHTFSPRVDMNVSDSFVIGQEPDLLRAGRIGNFTTIQIVPGDNVVNYGAIDFNIDVTQLLGFRVGYNNAYYNYSDSGVSTPFTTASQSGTLDRIEHRVVLDSQWKLSPRTMGILGYTYGQSVYNGNEQILTLNTGQAIFSSHRDSRSHTFYAGAQHAFNPNLSGRLTAGATYTDYYGDPAADNRLTPYLMASLNYLFQTTTAMELGASYTLSAANFAGQNVSSDFVHDQETALFYASVSHEIVAHLTGSAKATIQNATYNGGGPGVDGQGYLFYQLGFDLAYAFTPNIAAHIGYNYDNSDSDVPGQSYDRNRVYLGVTGSY